MKSIARFLLALLCVAPFGAANAVVSSTAGNNLTAYNGESGAANNNRWNTLMNSRTGGNDTAAVADFGNCNAIVMRCAQPKCSNGGCTDLNVTYAIVSGCVQSNEACKQYGNELIQYISAQLVAQSTARANDAANAASVAAAEAAAQQSAQQMAAMQMQMQQMQSEMAAQNAQQLAAMQSALDEQKQLTANAIAEATAARETQTVAVTPVASNTTVTTTTTSDSGLTGAQLAAAQNGVSADILAREQISGQIMSSIENAETQLKALKATMNSAFSYAGCDSRGNNCTGPKRVKMFKQKAEGFFDPYESVLDELYDALILAQSVGVDITDIYMMLNGSCNVWGQYLCSLGSTANGYTEVCDEITRTTTDGKKTVTEKCRSVPTVTGGTVTYNKDNCKNNKSQSSGRVRGGHECSPDAVVPPEDDTACVLNKTIVDDPDNPVQRDWLWAESNTDSGANIRVGCASSALESSMLFRNRKKQAKIDIETLEKIIAQDAPVTISRYRKNNDADETTERIKYCGVGSGRYADLQKWVATKNLPSNVCMTEAAALNQINRDGVLTASGERMMQRVAAREEYEKCSQNGSVADCIKVDRKPVPWSKPIGSDTNKCCAPADANLCLSGGGSEWENGTCTCAGKDKTFQYDYLQCMTTQEYCAEKETMQKDNNSCWPDCEKYCTNGGESNYCYKSSGDTTLTSGKKCKSSWDNNEKICKCKEE